MKEERINSYKDLIVWQRAMDLVVEVYKLSDQYPKHELYGLTGQTRKSAVSVPSNIAEGRKRSSRKDYCNFLMIAYGSGSELETQIEIAKRLGYAEKSSYNKVDKLLDEVMKMLNSMIGKLRT